MIFIFPFVFLANIKEEVVFMKSNVDRSVLENADVLKYYKDICSNTENLKQYIEKKLKDKEFIQTYEGYDIKAIQQETVEYISAVFKTSLDILTNEKYEPILNIIINTFSEVQKIGQASPFAYMVFHQVNRVYKYCFEKDKLLNGFLQQGSFENIIKDIINPNDLRPNDYVFDISEVLSKISAETDICMLLVDIELAQAFYELAVLELEYKEVFSDSIYTNKLRLMSKLQPLIEHDNKYILLPNSLLIRTMIANDISKFDSKTECNLPFNKFEGLERNKSKKSDYLLEIECFEDYYEKELVLELYTFEVYFSLMMFYNNIYCGKILLQVKKVDAEQYKVILKSFEHDILDDDKESYSRENKPVDKNQLHRFKSAYEKYYEKVNEKEENTKNKKRAEDKEKMVEEIRCLLASMFDKRRRYDIQKKNEDNSDFDMNIEYFQNLFARMFSEELCNIKKEEYEDEQEILKLKTLLLDLLGIGQDEKTEDKGDNTTICLECLIRSLSHRNKKNLE